MNGRICYAVKVEGQPEKLRWWGLEACIEGSLLTIELAGETGSRVKSGVSGCTAESWACEDL